MSAFTIKDGPVTAGEISLLTRIQNGDAYDGFGALLELIAERVTGDGSSTTAYWNTYNALQRLPVHEFSPLVRRMGEIVQEYGAEQFGSPNAIFHMVEQGSYAGFNPNTEEKPLTVRIRLDDNDEIDGDDAAWGHLVVTDIDEVD